jgi:hypothetical protein
LEQYRKSIKQFAEISGFEDFWNSNMPFYNQILDMTIADMGEIDFIQTLESYYNETKGSYNIIISPSFIGGYASWFSRIDGKDDLYACLSTHLMKDSIPYLDGNSLLHYVWHEFGHSFVNPLTEKYADKVMAVDKLFEPIKAEMSRQAYSQWNLCVNEHIIRAIHVRLQALHMGSQQSNGLLNMELNRRFIYIEPLVEKLKEFEKQRDNSNTTFSEFYPELLHVLDSLLKIEYWKQVNINFRGPIDAVSRETKLAIIYPTQDLDREALKIAQDYAFQVFDAFVKSEGGVLSFPFIVDNQIIYADREYMDKEIKFVSCAPNPHNPEKGMLICTALSNKAIQDINDVPQGGGYDYILFLDSETVISRVCLKTPSFFILSFNNRQHELAAFIQPTPYIRFLKQLSHDC